MLTQQDAGDAGAEGVVAGAPPPLHENSRRPEGAADGVNPLHYLAGAGVLDGCALLLEGCPQMNFAPDHRGRPALHWALRRGCARRIGQIRGR